MTMASSAVFPPPPSRTTDTTRPGPTRFHTPPPDPPKPQPQPQPAVLPRPVTASTQRPLKAAVDTADFADLLAEFRALSMYYQEVHWTLFGPGFYQDHLLAMRLHDDVDDSIDEIAEKGISVAGTTFVLLPAHLVAVQAILTKVDHSEHKTGELGFAEALKLEQALGEKLNALYTAEKAAGVSDLYQSLADGGLQRLYLLNARLGISV